MFHVIPKHLYGLIYSGPLMCDLIFKYLVTIFVGLTDGLNGNNFDYDREKLISRQICSNGRLADVEIN